MSILVSLLCRSISLKDRHCVHFRIERNTLQNLDYFENTSHFVFRHLHDEHLTKQHQHEAVLMKRLGPTITFRSSSGDYCHTFIEEQHK
jgi:hypothetical protein